MDKNKLKNILEKYLGEASDNGEELSFVCPRKYLHDESINEKKLNINPSKNVYHCFVCNFRGNDIGILLKFLGIDAETIKELKNYSKTKVYIEKEHNEEQEIIQLPPEFKPLSNGENNIYRFGALNYAKKRKLNNLLIERFNLGYSTNFRFKNYLIIPSYDMYGNLNFYQCRSIYDGDDIIKNINIKSKKSETIPFELYVDWKEPIIQVEGFFDMDYDLNCLPLFGSFVSNNKGNSLIIKKLIEFETPLVYVMFDPDAKRKAYNTMKKYFSYNIQSAYVDIGNFKDPHMLNKKQYRECIKNATKVTESFLFKFNALIS